MDVTIDFWGAVPVTGRGSLPFSLIHGEALVSSATLALESAGIDLCDTSVAWEQVRDTGRGLVLHDPLCPLTPPDFILAVVEQAGTGAIAVGVRPVTDTVKQRDGEVIGRTVDRESLRQVCSPVVLPPRVVEALPDWPQGGFEEIVVALRERWPVHFVEAPALARRVDSEESLAVLESLSVARAAEPPG